MKQRFSSLDVKVIAHELSNSLVTLRLSNVYDLSSKIFLFKFAKPENKKQLIVDSGFRCHLTSFSRATAAAPSDFVSRLRKYLKTRRVTSVAQVGTDRIIEFAFSDGQYRLFLEFYAGGNVILTDKELNILALLRVVSEAESQEQLRVGLKYSLEDRQNYSGVPPLTKARLQDALRKAADKGESGVVAGKKSKKKGADALRKALAVSITEYPPMLVDHAMKVTEFDSTLKPDDVLQSDSLLDHLLRSLEEAQRVVQEITSTDTAKGYIIAKTKVGSTAEIAKDDRGNLLYEDFHPYKPQQFADDPACTFLTFEGFNKTVDEFFSSIEGQRLQSKLEERELAAKKRLDAARQDQANRLGGLQEIQELNVRKAGAIEANVERVQEAMDAVNGLIAQGMDWVEIGKLIELEQKRNNPVAHLIKLPLKLHENTVTLLLGEEEFDEEKDDSADETDSDVSDEEDAIVVQKPSVSRVVDKRLSIDINLGESPYSNAREYYDQRRTAVIKEQKTLQSSTKALKSTEQKIAQDLKKGLKQEKAVLRPVRQQLWFEKFTWFISSDGYLVLGGRDAQQNEMLYKRYLRKGDIYVHADLQGAATIVIRNTNADAPIPPSTLSQAGTMAVASSSAWDSKAGMSAWWVNADQVSKSAPTGDFLPTGSFSVRGQKNFLPPAVLLLGFAVVFRIGEASKARHTKHRVQDDVAATPDVDVPEIAPQNGEEDEGDDDMDHTDQSDSDDGAEDGSDDGQAAETARTNPLQSGSGVAEPPTDGANGELQDMEDLKIDETHAADGQDVDNHNDDDNVSDDIQKDEPEADDVEEDAVDGDDDGSEGPSDAPKDEAVTGNSNNNASSKPAAKKGPTPLPRGKRSKAKKIAAKYAHQDEEDRLAAQSLIGAAAGRDKAEAEAAAKAARDAEAAFHKERRRAQHERTQKQTAEHEAARQAMLAATDAETTVDGTGMGTEAADDADAQRSTALDAFIGTPLPHDEILEAVPVCAPWSALGKYKYKAKLQPGAQKKGKAIKEILGRWMADATAKGRVDGESMDVERMWPREVDLLRGWRPEECVNVVPVSKVRVVMAGGMGGGVGGGSGGGGGGKGGGKGRGGRGSKKR